MAILDSIKRINYQDFKEEDRETIHKLAETLNFFMEDVVNNMNGGIDFDNLNRELLTFEITVDENGIPITNNRFSSALSIVGTKVIRADNLVNSAQSVTTSPFITYRNSGTGIYTITNVTGLQVNTKYRLIIELIAN
jgi:hypothetical protein